MLIPTEPIGSIPRPGELLDIQEKYRLGNPSKMELADAYDIALKDTIKRFEATGSRVISDGEQRKSSFANYPLEGLTNITDDGIEIQFEDGHSRHLPRLTAGPFRYQNYAVKYLQSAFNYALRNEPYTAAKLNYQLDDQARQFLDNKEKGLKIEKKRFASPKYSIGSKKILMPLVV